MRFPVRPTGDSSSKGSQINLLSVKLTCRCNGSCCMCGFAWVFWLCGLGGWEIFSSAMLRHSGLSGSWNLLSPFIWIAWLFLFGSFGLILAPLSSHLSDFPVLGNLPRGEGVGKPSLGKNVMLGIYSKYDEYLSVWLNVAHDCYKLYHGLRLYLDVSPWMIWFLEVGISYLFLRLEKLL